MLSTLSALLSSYQDDTDDLLTQGNKPFGSKTYMQTLADLMNGDAASQKKCQEIKSLKERMTEWQKRTLYFVWENSRFLHTITGPPGTGKSTLIAILSRMLNILCFKVLLLASSNVVVDALMGKAKRYDAEDQAIRSHSLQFETSQTKKAPGKAKSSKQRAAIPSSSFPAEYQGTFPRGANILQTSGVGLLCGWNAVIGSMRAQYPTVPSPTVEQL